MVKDLIKLKLTPKGYKNMIQEKIINKLQAVFDEKVNDESGEINLARQTAIHLIEEVIEPYFEVDIVDEEYYDLEDKLTNVITKMITPILKEVVDEIINQ